MFLKQKKLLILSAFVSCGYTTAVWADAPNLLTYQGRLQESGVLVTGFRSINITLCDALVGGNCIDTGTQTVAVSSGLYRTVFSIPSAAGLDNLAAGYMQVSVGTDAAHLVVLAPREQLTSSPYALAASSAAHSVVSDTAGVAAGVQVTAAGRVSISDGNEAAGRVLTSDANGGHATWQDAPLTHAISFGRQSTFPFSVPAVLGNTGTTYTFNSLSTTTVLMVEMWGAGGGGGSGLTPTIGGPSVPSSGGSGGGGGAYVKVILRANQDFIPGDSITVTVGNGGLGAPGGGFDGTPGGSSSFSISNGAVTANGGGAGRAGTFADSLGGSGGAGSTAGHGGIAIVGGTGDDSHAGLVTTVRGGTAPGSTGNSYGAGGSGGGVVVTTSNGVITSFNAQPGGAGNDGFVIVWY